MQIDTAYRASLARSDLNEFEPKEKRLEVSSICKWFEETFQKVGGIKKVLSRYAPQRAFKSSDEKKK